MKNLFIGLWAVLTALCFWGWNHAKNTCCVPTTAVVAPVKVVKSHGPLVFNWASGAAITSDAFPAYRDSILGTLGENDKLEITGLYTKEETNASSFENMGLARANETKKLFLDFLPADRIVLKSKLEDNVSNKDDLFAAANFRPLRKSKAIVEIDDRVVIYFPLNSSSKLNSTEIENYLDKVAAKVKTTGEIVDLTGHTCDRGDTHNNVILGERRANIISRYLMNKGVSKNQIVTKSKGETSPMVPNTSEDNRVKNRRTVLRILNKN